MTAFFSEVLETFLTPAFLEGVRRKFHYEETRKKAFQAVAEEMLPFIRREAFWSSGAFPAFGQRETASGAIYESVVMSLGSGLDVLQEHYTEAGMLSESYMIEVLAGELLLKGYGAYDHYVEKERQWHVARYHFPGSEEAFPLEMLPEMLEQMGSPVACNEAFCMIPKKSVAFVAELTQDANVQCGSICLDCHDLHCPNRIKEIWTEEEKTLSIGTKK